jgi:membrane-associated phospholipid phosphatase
MSIFDFPSRAAWAVLAAIGIVAFGGLEALGVPIKLSSFALPLGASAACLAVSSFYQRYRPDRRLATMTAGTAFLLVFSVAGASLSYPATAIGGPLQDRAFIAFERALGVDWPALAAAMTANPYGDLAWALIYMSSLPMLAVTVVVLALSDRAERLAAFLWLLVITVLPTIVGSILAPALGPIPSYGIEGAVLSHLGPGGKDFLVDFQALRAGRFVLFDLAKVEGLITFPSFHCVMAALTAWALAPIRRLGIAASILSALVVLSTVPQGGHYIADIFAGLAVALGAIAAVRLFPVLRPTAPKPLLTPAE